MPYQDPERKRQWEREHREQRNARRRQQRLEAQDIPVVHNRVATPVPAKESWSGWKVLTALACGVGIVLIGAMAGVNLPNPGRSR